MALFGDNTATFDTCLGDEQDAHERLVENWATFSTTDKVHCVLPAEYLPSYVEWLTCLEMEIDFRKMRKWRGRPNGFRALGQEAWSTLLGVAKNMPTSGRPATVLNLERPRHQFVRHATCGDGTQRVDTRPIRFKASMLCFECGTFLAVPGAILAMPKLAR